MIGDLLHGLDLHGDVEPDEDVGFGMARGRRFRISAPFQITVIAKAAILRLQAVDFSGT
ncbi:hypothetical protein [Mesorhizobium silamurunense]|uniref:hypothetical protein n=1 Tax=Mesorhizobium silamurunense TaxID=499528 RepID=UPI00177F787C|nr:hypothetical protein [Mesorhizobium silamurunense]